ncbi:DUF6960 family protein [Photorhabdus cinerea]|uniref:Uncharacterized protein n=1 Tax=Photorhabdus cinerea TaxID=471575 RepID=A0A7X5QGQ7_9GAMM|nr:hypothetical protein [Photorhabdus cinerea]NHB94064.1 hypothetical protein [Photorhabdus cinerea]
MINSLDLKGTWGLYPWFDEDDVNLIYPDDLERVRKLILHGKVFYCSEQCGKFIRLNYGDYSFRVKPDLFKPVREVHFMVGDNVKVASSLDKRGTILNIGWHHKNDEPIYYLSFNGKKSSRRYAEDELIPVQE